MVSYGERPGKRGAPQLTSSLIYSFLVTLTLTGSSSEQGTSWWINIILLYLLPWFPYLLVPLIPFPWPDAMGLVNLTTPAPERLITGNMSRFVKYATITNQGTAQGTWQTHRNCHSSKTWQHTWKIKYRS